MEELLQQLEQAGTREDAAARRGRSQVRMPALRIALAIAAGLLFVGLALAHDDPVVMLVGLAPLAMISVEAVWRLFDDID